jgi:hypothetical protein
MAVDQVDEGDPLHRRAGSPSRARPGAGAAQERRRGGAEAGRS